MTSECKPVAPADWAVVSARRALLLERVEPILKRYYPPTWDPYRQFEREIAAHLKPEHTILDAGCGRTAPVLSLFAPRVARAIGVDLVEFSSGLSAPNLRLLKNDLRNMAVDAASVDVLVARSVLEHLQYPAAVYAEFCRVLKPGGKFVFITPNIWSYPIIAAAVIPNRFHAAIVKWGEGRLEADTFATYYRSNSLRAIRKLAAAAGFQVCSLRYINMFPNYLMFNRLAFLLGVAYDQMISRVRLFAPLQHWILGVLMKPAEGGPPASAPAN